MEHGTLPSMFMASPIMNGEKTEESKSASAWSVISNHSAPSSGDLEQKSCVTKDFRDPKQDHLQVVTKEVQSRQINSSRSRTRYIMITQ
ncbi:hypothetical protein ACS0TY_003943 [Phlomoides rotata]